MDSLHELEGDAHSKSLRTLTGKFLRLQNSHNVIARGYCLDQMD